MIGRAAGDPHRVPQKNYPRPTRCNDATEWQVCQNPDATFAGGTTFLLPRRLSILKNSDRILCVDRDSVFQRGTPID